MHDAVTAVCAVCCISQQIGQPVHGDQHSDPLAKALTPEICWYFQVTRAVFEASKGRLKVVGRAGVGIDNVDLQAATEVRCFTSPRSRCSNVVRS